MLAKDTINDLKREHIRLQGLLDSISQRIGAIEALLTSDTDLDPAPSPREVSVTTSSNGNGQQPFSRLIREVLQDLNRAARPKQIAQRLEQKGVTSPRNSPLSVVVNGELARMAKNNVGGVRRIRKGLYKISPSKESGPETRGTEPGPKSHEGRE